MVSPENRSELLVKAHEIIRKTRPEVVGIGVSESPPFLVYFKSDNTEDKTLAMNVDDIYSMFEELVKVLGS